MDAEDARLRARPSRLTAIAGRGARAFIDLVVPPLCVACKAPLADHDALCAECWQAISFIRAPVCDRLGIPLPYDTGPGALSAAAIARPPAYDRARAVAHHDGVMRRLVHGLKYADRHDGVRLLGRWLASAGAELLPHADVLVPVPLHPWRLWQRRFNQSALLAQALARQTGHPVTANVLIRVRRTASQVGLSPDQRRRNVEGAFRIRATPHRTVDGRSVVLVDDVRTTGATVEACARALRRAGARRVDVLTLSLVADAANATS
jgi:ComF family protein